MKFQNLSIKRKLMLITMLTSTMALVLFSASFLVYDLISFRHFLTEDLATQAQIYWLPQRGRHGLLRTKPRRPRLWPP